MRRRESKVRITDKARSECPFMKGRQEGRVRKTIQKEIGEEREGKRMGKYKKK